jgi:hypothetical protein
MLCRSGMHFSWSVKLLLKQRFTPMIACLNAGLKCPQAVRLIFLLL